MTNFKIDGYLPLKECLETSYFESLTLIRGLCQITHDNDGLNKKTKQHFLTPIITELAKLLFESS